MLFDNFTSCRVVRYDYFADFMFEFEYFAVDFCCGIFDWNLCFYFYSFYSFVKF